jgi:hypothetical protein
MAEENSGLGGNAAGNGQTKERLRKIAGESLAGKRAGKPGRPSNAEREAFRNNGKTPPPAMEENTDAPPVVSAEDIKFVEKTADAFLGIIDRLITGKVYNAVAGIDKTLEPKAREFAMQVEISREERDLVASACGAVATKYSALARFAPELALVSWSVGYSGRVVSTLSEVKKLVAEVNKLRRPAKTPDPIESDGTIPAPAV